MIVTVKITILILTKKKNTILNNHQICKKMDLKKQEKNLIVNQVKIFRN